MAPETILNLCLGRPGLRTGRALHLKQRPEHPKASCEDLHDGKHGIENVIPPSQHEITTKQQPKGGRMIVEDHDMSDCLATYGYKSRLDREDFPLSSRSCIRQPVDSKIHHSFLNPSNADIFRNFKFFCAPPSLKWNWLLSHKVFMSRLSNRRGHFGKDHVFCLSITDRYAENRRG